MSPQDRNLPFRAETKSVKAAQILLDANSSLTLEEVASAVGCTQNHLNYQVIPRLEADRRFVVIRSRDARGKPTVRVRWAGGESRDEVAEAENMSWARRAFTRGPELPLDLDDNGTVAFNGVEGTSVAVIWSKLPTVTFRGTVGDSVPTAVLCGKAPVQEVVVRANGQVELQLDDALTVAGSVF